MSGPDRIWAFDYDLQDEDGTWRRWQCWAEDHPKPMRATEYIRRDPAVIAALPEVQAMIAEAVAKEREACARMVDCGCDKGQKAAVIDAENGADRARACGQYNCGAEDAAAIRKRGEG